MAFASNEKKPEWKTRSNLSAKGFFYDDDIFTKALPDHVKTLRDSMLNFNDHGFDQKLDDKNRRIRDRAKDCVTGDVSEQNWKIFFDRSFFTPLIERTSASHGSRRVTPYNNGNNNIVADSEALWVTFDIKGGKLGDSMPDDFRNASAPKPDYAFYFPMDQLTARVDTSRLTPCYVSGVSATLGNMTKGVLEIPEESTSPSVESFSFSALKELYQHGLRPSPFNAFKKEVTEKHLRCFPWLVIEMKKKHTRRGLINKSKEEAYCQAANGSGCAVRLNQIAAKFAVELPGQGQIPPIPAVTTAGPEVKVWITYFAKNFIAHRSHTKRGQCLEPIDQGYMMQCIWTGDMTNLEDVKKFRLILGNTYDWATQVFKPMMNTYIRQWKFFYSEDGRSFATAAMEREQQRKELSRKALRFVLATLGDEKDLNADDDLRRAAKLRLVDLCDRFVQDTDQIIAEELEKLHLKNDGDEGNV
ncbi:unnamed protein product [Fusarium graminearum]|nr:hypothetical protein HG531_013669 [Fusarium graminearum]CAG1959553.1 unnamed protein product [Fusarium graminearum]CAG1962280.1 unnamed protein product [Fusarium graminearum]CAG2006226.1 unnamed protein product [Fusarium graminearum]